MVFIIFSIDTINLDNKVFEIAKKLNCQVCAGENVAYSQSDLAVDMRNKIRELLREGKTEKEILDYFVSVYGEQVLAEPPKKGFFNFLWIIPNVVIILSILGILLYFAIKKKN
ncbi:MAG: cytochrome c-type biogenesis protein CcmH [candidate division WOR-3 bacterium]|nr:cytochrome c-type biogenesis protein CcmH [candidate division WOR-3 bacterium]MCX7946988.1 cytochrome c-type biogenesis protein CcmH [candidate division WOR-3 bacterium]MDW8149971.1 cytochrome c-type biogenesis protein CcmH [candidate division WOR-3 bacterium]